MWLDYLGKKKNRIQRSKKEKKKKGSDAEPTRDVEAIGPTGEDQPPDTAQTNFR